MTINLTRENFEQAIKSGASVFEGNTILDANNNVAARHMFRISGVETEKYKPTARNISLNL